MSHVFVRRRNLRARCFRYEGTGAGRRVEKPVWAFHPGPGGSVPCNQAPAEVSAEDLAHIVSECARLFHDVTSTTNDQVAASAPRRARTRRSSDPAAALEDPPAAERSGLPSAGAPESLEGSSCAREILAPSPGPAAPPRTLQTARGNARGPTPQPEMARNGGTSVVDGHRNFANPVVVGEIPLPDITLVPSLPLPLLGQPMPLLPADHATLAAMMQLVQNSRCGWLDPMAQRSVESCVHALVRLCAEELGYVAVVDDQDDQNGEDTTPIIVLPGNSRVDDEADDPHSSLGDPPAAACA